MIEKKIFVTQPVLPNLEEFIPMLEKIWESKWLTNNGNYHQELEKKMANYLGIPYISLVSNGTLALIIALQCLRITGEVITTPYSFVATTHALYWKNIKPIFCDIEPDYLTLDSDKIEAMITPKTTAILPVHIYGNPCNTEKIERIADKYDLKVIYDAAHAFGVKQNGETILNYGDLSILSFHATKVFNTIEGGAIISHDAKTKKRVDNLKNFGIVGENTIVTSGINGKMNEIQSAYGLLQLNSIDESIQKRKKIAQLYSQQLAGIKGISVLKDIDGVEHNYAFYPIFVNKDKFGHSRDELFDELKKHNINGRKYYYPLISQLSTYKGLDSSKSGNLPIAEKVTRQVICLPIHPQLMKDDIAKIINIIKGKF
jgi:dTDP-4-amino-4,6-dideoxygalactose transaminase